jgi:hypothetical protein
MKSLFIKHINFLFLVYNSLPYVYGQMDGAVIIQKNHALRGPVKTSLLFQR